MWPHLSQAGGRAVDAERLLRRVTVHAVHTAHHLLAVLNSLMPPPALGKQGAGAPAHMQGGQGPVAEQIGQPASWQGQGQQRLKHGQPMGAAAEAALGIGPGQGPGSVQMGGGLVGIPAGIGGGMGCGPGPGGAAADGRLGGISAGAAAGVGSGQGPSSAAVEGRLGLLVVDSVSVLTPVTGIQTHSQGQCLVVSTAKVRALILAYRDQLSTRLYTFKGCAVGHARVWVQGSV